MKFSEAISTVELVLESGNVPLIIGEAGIGKTSLVKKICVKDNYYLVNIDANLLKEGEIGGLPIVENGRTKYATHYKLKEIQEAIGDNKYNGVLLFIDELNRCEHAVQQELMNLILNREINGYRLYDNVKIVAAMNPSNKYDGFEDSDYQVVDMDRAQEDRFVWIELSTDIKEWIKWAMSSEVNVHENIIEFLSNFPEYLNVPNSNESIKATPRSWERVAKAYNVYLERKEIYSLDIFYNVVKGNLGVSIATDFVNYIKNIKNPLIKPEDLFSYVILPIEVKDEIRDESHSRLYILAKNSLRYLNENNNEINRKIFSDLLTCYPKDLRLGIMKEIKNDISQEAYIDLLNEDTFLDAFFSIYE
ncbi:AAA family ATPase [Clostridium sp. Sa3CUN1]|uniref:AAA family ATPase n=1 Tax=Clostridium gallinarum TaxID=2762246 RepID=A0ABR8Q4X2_9CLOT|nr:ATP-binding protein [Clostridium gallinarum]MBD7915458.1 AAA family ATPase [Clostridium gallinarum]